MNRKLILGSLGFRLLLALMLVCVSGVNTTNAEQFIANLDASQVVGSSTETGTAVAAFVLDESSQNLSYTIELFGLDLKSDAGSRTEFSDVTAIHLHNGFADSFGPHVLNIFGIPSEDDAEMFVDFENDTISGIFNDADAIDPATGMLFDQLSPLSTKLLSNFVDDLQSEQIYLAVHTAGQGGGIAIRGQLTAVPEPGSLVVVLAGFMCYCGHRRRK